MKKLLALVLALVMTLSLATVSTNAAFEDADDISYEEAANVLSAVGVFVGDGKNFNPKAALNREQAAKLVAYLALGEDVAEALPSVAMFDDVAASSWAAKYIAYCADAGIITGDGAGKFYPTAPVDGYAFAKMLLCALGYKAEAEGYTGSNWSINVATDAKAAGFNVGFNGKFDKNLTREEAAQIMFNAIKANKIDSYSATGNSVTIGDVVVNQNWGTATPGGVYYEVQWDGVAGNDYLTLSDPAATDAFGREANEWRFNGDVVSCVAKEAPAFVITKDLTEKEVASMLKGYKLGSAEYKVNDDVISGGPAGYSVTGNAGTLNLSTTSPVDVLDALFVDGKVVEIYAGVDKVIDQIVVLDYNFDEVADITVNAKTGAVTYDFTNAGSGYVNDEDTTSVVFAAEVAEDDYVTTFYGLDGKLYVYPTTKMVGECTSYTQAGVYTIGGDTYTASEAAASGLTLGIADEANYWLDQYGFIVKTTSITTSSKNYALVLGYENDSDTTFGSFTAAVKVKVLLSDGTVGIYDAKTAKKEGGYYLVDADGAITGGLTQLTTGAIAGLEGTVFSYVLSGNTIALNDVAPLSGNGTDGAFATTLYEGLDDSTVAYVAKNDTALYTAYEAGVDASAAVMNAKTTYIFWDADDEKATVVVGNGNLGDYEFGYANDSDAVVNVSETGKLTAAYVFVMSNWNSDAATTEKYGYVDFSKYTASKVGDDNVRTYTMTLVDGTEMKVTMKNSYNAGAGLYEYNTDATVGSQFTEHVKSGACTSYADGVAVIGGVSYSVASDVKVVDLSDEYNTLEDANVIAVLDKDEKVVQVAYIFD